MENPVFDVKPGADAQADRRRIPLNCLHDTPLRSPCDETDLSAVLAAWRARNDLKLETAAAELGVSTATWSHWEQGRRFPNARNLGLLAAYTGLGIRQLLCRYAETCGCRQMVPGKCPSAQTE